MADSSVAITAGSGTPIRVLTGLGAGSADQQVVTLADSAGNLLGTAAAPVPVGLTGGSANIGHVVLTDAGNTNAATVKPASTAAVASDPAFVVALHPSSPVNQQPSTLAVTATAALTTAATASLPAAGVGLFHYITSIQITLYSAAARTGAATPWVVTSTNLPGTPAWTFSTAGAIGANETQTLTPATPIKSTAANTATTIVGPAATSGIWRITVTYYVA